MLTMSERGNPHKIPAWCGASPSIDLGNHQIEELLDRLDEEHGPEQTGGRRKPGGTWRDHPLLVEINVSLDEKRSYLAVTRDISPGGMSFLYTHPVPQRSRVRVMPATAAGMRWPVNAQVAEWRPVGKRVYEIRLRFVGARKGEVLMERPTA